MSEMTATRMRGVAILALAALWLAAAAFLWRTSVPADLDLPELEPADYFSSRELARHERYERLLRALFFPAVLVQLAVLAALVIAAPRLLRRLPYHPVVQGAILAFGAVLALWLARLPVAAVGHWWRRRYGIARQDYLEWLVHAWLRLRAAGAGPSGA